MSDNVKPYKKITESKKPIKEMRLSQDDLEMAIDSDSLQGIIEKLSFIAYEKASHIRENWQDEGLARSWEKDAKALDRFGSKLEN